MKAKKEDLEKSVLEIENRNVELLTKVKSRESTFLELEASLEE